LLAGVPIDQVAMLLRPQQREDHREALRAVGTCKAGSAGQQRSQVLGGGISPRRLIRTCLGSCSPGWLDITSPSSHRIRCRTSSGDKLRFTRSRNLVQRSSSFGSLCCVGFILRICSAGSRSPSAPLVPL
jgi:hypothetical protein